MSSISRKLKLFLLLVNPQRYENKTLHASDPKKLGQNGTSGEYFEKISIFKINECPARIVSVQVWSEINWVFANCITDQNDV